MSRSPQANGRNLLTNATESLSVKRITGISSQIEAMLRDWAVGQAGAGCYSRAALSSNDSKTRYIFLKQTLRLI